MKKVIIASKNPVKINATKKAFEEVLNDHFEFEGVSADSSVSDQPMSNKETLQGATNRLDNIQNLKANFFVSIEGGVDLLDDNYEAFAWIVISHKNKISKAMNRKFSMPFIFLGNKEEEVELKNSVKTHGLNIQFGGRVLSLGDKVSKGNAMMRFISLLSNETKKNYVSICLGDNENDFDLLKDGM